MPETLEPQNSGNHLPLPPSVVLGTEAGERYPQSELWNGLREERETWCLDNALAAARSEMVTHSAFLESQSSRYSESTDRDLALQGMTFRLEANTLYPRGRVELRALGHAVGDDQLIKKIQSLQRDESMDFDSGRGFAVRITGFRKGRFDWQLRLGQELESTDRAKAMDDFSAKVTEYLDKDTRAAREIQAGLATNQHEVFSSEVFSWASETDELTGFATNSNLVQGLAGIQMGDSPTMARAKTIEALYRLPAHYAGEDPGHTDRAGIYFDPQGRVEKVLMPARNPGVYFALKSADPTQRGDLSELDLQLGMEVHPDETYEEFDYNRVRREGTKPFIESTTAAQLLHGFEAAGLQPSETLRAILAETHIEKRYGQGYASLTREIAKLVNDPNRDLAHLFEDGDGAAANKIRSLSDVADPAAGVVVALLKGVADRTAHPQDAPQLPLSEHRIEMRDGSCKDIEEYLATGSFAVDSQTNVRLRDSSYARPVTMLLQPAYLNGVRLPAGSLLAIEKDGYLFMRVTAFAFGDEQALETFGPQEAENRENNYGVMRSVIQQRMAA